MLLFKRPAEIARMLDCTQPAIDRWIRKVGLPKLSYLPAFEDAFCDLLQWLEDQGFSGTADSIDDERPTGSAKHKFSPDACLSWLRDYLAEKPRRYSDVIAEAAKKKFTRSQVGYAAKRLGVLRERHAGNKERVKKFTTAEGKKKERTIEGSKGYSLWKINADK